MCTEEGLIGAIQSRMRPRNTKLMGIWVNKRGRLSLLGGEGVACRRGPVEAYTFSWVVLVVLSILPPFDTSQAI